MAHGWDSYYHNLPPLSSDQGTLRRTSDSEGTLSQHIDNLIGHHDFSTLDSHEDPVSNSNFNTNYCPNSSIANSSSECVYQRYCSETQWQADGEQMEKDYLQECVTSDIPDFVTDGLPSSGSFPSSFATDLQGLKQDCGMLATSFLENYSDVSSCSDADVGETRPPCNFMASNLCPKPKTDVATRHSSSDWSLTHTGSMTFPTVNPNMSETGVILPSNVKAGETVVECAQDKIESPENTVKSGHDQLSTTSYMTTSVSETVRDRNFYDRCQDQKQKEDVERDLTQGKYSDISISGHENLTGDGMDEYADGNEEGQITSAASNIITTVDNEQEHFDEKVFGNEMKELFNQENQGFDHPNSYDGQDGIMSEDEQDKGEVLKRERNESDSLENEISDEHKSPIANSVNYQDENMDICNQEKEIQTNISQSSDPPAIEASNSNDSTHELWESTSTLRSDSHDVESNLQLSENQSYKSVAQDSICRSLAEMSDGHLSNASVASLLQPSLQPKSFSTNINLCLNKELTSAAWKTNTVLSPDPDCIGPDDGSDSSPIDTKDKSKQGVASHVDSCLQSHSSSTGADPLLDKELASASNMTNMTYASNPDCSGLSVPNDCLSRDTSARDDHCVGIHVDSCLQPNNSSTDMHPSQEMEMTSPSEKKTTTSPDQDCGGSNVTSDSLSIDTSDKNKQTVASHPESYLHSDSSDIDKHPCLEKAWASPAEMTSTTSSTDPKCSGYAVSSDSNKTSHLSGLESCSRPNISNTDMDSCSEEEWTSPGETTNTTSSPDQQQSLHKSQVAQDPQSSSGDVTENARESFEEMDLSTEEPPAPDMLYGEPLSREDSSCDTDETKLISSQYKETSVARPDRGSKDHSERQAPQLTSSLQMRKLLHPVVVLSTLESTSGVSDSYHCADCKHTTHTVDHLIEHHHHCHSMHNFQFCNICNLYLMSNEQAEKHFCGVIKKRPRLSSDFSQQKKRNHHGRHRCNKCRLVFGKIVHYIKHMRTHTGKTPFQCINCGLYFAQSSALQRHKRVPGRCKQSKLPLTNSDATISKTQTPLQKDVDPYANMQACYVKLVDIAKSNLCGLCGKSFPSAKKAKRHRYSVHKVKSMAVPLNQHTAKISDEQTHKAENEIREKHKCPLCPRLFKYSYNRARHLRDCARAAIYGGKKKVNGRYLCPLCPATFSLSHNRYRHIQVVCLRECLNRLAKEKEISRQMVRKQNTKENEQRKQSEENEHKTHPKENEQKTQPKENEQKRQALPTSTSAKTVPRYKCSLCPAVFYHPSGKYKHMKKHELFKNTEKMLKYKNSFFPVKSKPEPLSSTKTEKSKDHMESTESSGLILSCHFCGRCFSTSKSLKSHERNHRGERPYRCLECGKGFKKHAHLIGHKRVHQRRIQCTVCRKILPTVGELIHHRNMHLKKGMLQCPDCHLQFQYPAHLLRHLDSHKNSENNAPQLEEGTPLKPQQSLESVNEQNGPKELQCSLCKEVFNDAQVLRKHCLTHISGSSSNQCPFCRRNFDNRRNLLRHMIKHTGDKPLSCSNCGKQFYRHIFLELHSQKCLPPPTRNLVATKANTETKRPYKCSICPRLFFKKDRIKRHYLAHKANSLIQCSKCGQYFGINQINKHQKNCGETTELRKSLSPANDNFNKSTSHTSQNVPKTPLQSNAPKLPFKCPHCTQRFRYRSLFFRHLVSHTGVQPYPCMHCGRRFGSQSMCLQHEAFCNGVYKEGLSKPTSGATTNQPNMPTLREAAQKPQVDDETEFKCRFCTKTFMKSRNLRRHILTHNEVKPYRCKACDSCFSRHDHLKVHQTRCKGRKRRLEICIPKISLDDVGKGWQNKFGTEAAKKQETFDCDVCSRSFPTQLKLSRHITMFHTIKLFKCTRCGSAFSHEKSLKKHRKMNKCRKFSNEANPSLPLGTNPPAENVARPLDGMRNRILLRIRPHLNKKNKYVCNYCPRAFASSWQLGVHLRLHTGEKPYSCDYCGQRFIRKDYVKRHFPKCTKKQQQGKVLCDRCGGFFFSHKLGNHKKGCTATPGSSSTVGQSPQSTSKSPPKGFSCAYCSSRFLLFSQLQEHFLSAHKLETMIPPVSTAPLQQHLSNIPNIKEEPLDESCDESLSDGANLTCKLDTALDREVTREFFCSDCNMSFVNKAGLMGHLRSHTNGHPFHCKICNRHFWNKSLLRNHYRKCKNGHITTQQSEAPLKAVIDFALNDSVLVFKESSKTTGTGVLQTNFSCKDDSANESPQDSEETQEQSSSRKEKKEVQYQCSECDKSFTDGLMLISHLEDHGRQEQERKRNTCNKCGRVCASQRNLEKHVRMHRINKTCSCPVCSKMFYTTSDLELHRTCHDPNRPYSCKLCYQRFWTRPALCNHYSEEHVDDVFTCQFCSKSYAVKKSLARHYKKWHQKEQKDLASTAQEKNNSEQQSSSQGSTPGESDEGENNGSEDSDSDSAPYFPCHVCGKTFPTSETLEDHQLCHLGEKPHECAECGKCFFQASQLQQHQRMHKSEFQCQTCGRGFVTLFALRKHKHTHGKSRPHRCSKCHLGFTGPLQLAEHMSTHREENFPCDICNRMFLSKSSRAEHRKSHYKSGGHPPPSVSKGERQQSASPSESSFALSTDLKYRCGVCHQRFKDPEMLSEHGCMEAKERPYSCTDCDKHFLHASHLKKHRATHLPSLSNREYPCNQCNSRFSSSQHFLSHLKRHVDTAAKIKRETEGDAGGPSHVFICPVCHQCFASATELIHHFPTHPDGAFECENKAIPSGRKLEEHERHNLASAAKYKCTKCRQSFCGGDAFRQHHCSGQQQAIVGTKYSKSSAKTSGPISQSAGEEEEIDILGEDLFNCVSCSMQFSSKSSLLEHQNTNHSDGKSFKCEICGKTFARKRYLRRHELRHSQKVTPQKAPQLPASKVKCTRCHMKFDTAQDLSLHMRLHAEKEVGEYRCDMCYKSFSLWSLLKQHQESHVGEVVYECTECDKAFAFPHLLEEHQKTHAGSSQ